MKTDTINQPVTIGFFGQLKRIIKILFYGFMGLLVLGIYLKATDAAAIPDKPAPVQSEPVQHDKQQSILHEEPEHNTAKATKTIQAKEIVIPRSVADKGRYILLSKKAGKGTLITVHKRIGVDNVGYTKSELNCKKHLIRNLAYGEDDINNMEPTKSDWYTLDLGSSKSDLFNFVCH